MLSISLEETILHHNHWPTACGMRLQFLSCLERGSTYVDVLLRQFGTSELSLYACRAVACAVSGEYPW